jgi:hypothetical protein
MQKIMATNELAVIEGDRSYFLPVDQPRVTVHERPGRVVYVTRDGWLGIRLDGEGRRVDEWQPCQVRR